MATSILSKILFFLLLVVTAYGGAYPSDPDICDADFWISTKNPFNSTQAICTTVQQQLDSKWCAQAPACLGDSAAVAAATVPSITVGTATTNLLQFPGLGFAYNSTGFVLSTTNGGPGISRGVVFLPETGVAGEAYAPIARNMSGRGFYTFVLTETYGKSTDDIIGQVYQALATRSDLTAWALVGHGNGGTVASKIIGDDNNHRFNALAMFGAVTYPGTDLRNVNLELLYVYGGLDTVVTPAQAQNVIANYLPRDTLVIRMPNAAHFDFAFTTCVGNSFTPGRGGCSNFRLWNPLSSLSLPAANTGSQAVNPENPIVQTNGADGVLQELSRNFRAESTAYYDEATSAWVSTTASGDDLSDFLFVDGGDTVQLTARTNRRGYADVRAFLEGKRVRAQFSARNHLDTQCVEFTVGAAPALSSNAASTMISSVAGPQPNLYAAIAQLFNAMVGRAATPRGLSFLDNSVLYPVGARNNSKIYPANYYAPVEAQIIDVPSTDPNVPLTTQWYVLRPKAPAVPLGAYVYFPGAAVQAQAYSGLAFEIAARGYLVVIPTVPLRISTLNVPVFSAIYNSTYFADVPAGKWAVGGHSLGGIAACQAVLAYPNQIKALVMDAGGLVGSFVNRPQRVAQIYGSLDGLSPGGSERFRTPYVALTNPALTQFVAIQGGTHYGFADYGYHYPDNVATISLESQQSQAAELTVSNLQLAFQ